MTDLEMARLCAEALGMLEFHYYPRGAYPDQHGSYEVIGDRIYRLHGNPHGGYNRYHYDPRRDDAQAMALVKRFQLTVQWIDYCSEGWPEKGWECFGDPGIRTRTDDLNKSVVECVAKMQKAKQGTVPPTVT